jgi:ankyrin repeat protein
MNLIKRNYIYVYLLTLTLVLIGCGKKLEDSKDKNPKSSTPETEVSDYNIVQDLRDELYQAITSNDTLMTEHAYDRNESVDFKFENGETPLTLAIKLAKTEIVSFIIEKTKNLNLRNASGQTALIISLQMQKTYSLNQLIKNKVDLNHTDSNGIAPLMYAYAYSKERTILKLLKYGANGNIKDTSEVPFKKLLAQKKYIKAWNLLSNINSVNENPLSSLELIKAIESNNLLFIEYVLLNSEDYSELLKEENFLFNAINIDTKKKRKEVLRLLLKYGANPNNSDKILPLIHSIVFEQPETMSLLFAYSANPLTIDHNNRKSLGYAVELGNFEMVKQVYKQIIRKYQRNWSINLYKERREACVYLPSKYTIRNNSSLNKKEVKKIQNYLNCNN